MIRYGRGGGKREGRTSRGPGNCAFVFPSHRTVRLWGRIVQLMMPRATRGERHISVSHPASSGNEARRAHLDLEQVGCLCKEFIREGDDPSAEGHGGYLGRGVLEFALELIEGDLGVLWGGHGERDDLLSIGLETEDVNNEMLYNT